MRARLTNGATRLGVLLALLCAPLPSCHKPPAQAPAVAPKPAAQRASAASGPSSPDAPLPIAVEDDAGPWSLADGSGYANDVVRAAFAASGVPIELKVVPYARAKQMVQTGEAAACFSMSHSPENDAAIAFAAEPLFSCQAECFESVAKPLAAKAARDLPAGTVLGIVLGYEYPPAVYALERAGTVKLEEAASESLNLKKLAQGRINAALGNDNEIKTAGYLITKAGVQGQVRPAFNCGDLDSYIGFSRKHPRGLAALERYNAGYATIKQDGTLDKIKQEWAGKLQAELASLQSTAPGGAARD